MNGSANGIFFGLIDGIKQKGEVVANSKTSTLTSRQRQIYEFLKDKILDRGYGPTVREIGSAFGIRSPNGVMCHLKALEKKGLITRESRMSRAIQLTERPLPSTSLSLAGRIALHSPLLSIGVQEQIDFSTLFASNHVCLRVDDDCLIEDQIAAGDYLIARKQQSYRDGDSIVATVDSRKIVVRRYHQDTNGIRLDSIRSDRSSISSSSIEVIGILIGVIRRQQIEIPESRIKDPKATECH